MVAPMPKIRTLTPLSESPTLTEFTDPVTTKVVAVTTDDDGLPIAVTGDGTTLELIRELNNVRSWLGAVGGVRWQVETVGGYPGMIGRLLT